MTPMIDCVFQLLLFFLVASHFEEEAKVSGEGSLEANLPEAAAAMPMVMRPRELIININARGEFYIGGNFGTNPLAMQGVFAALDLHTNKLVWQQQWADRCLSGSIATAGGLVFIGRNDGRLTALNTANGAKLWEFQTGAGMNAPVSTFEHRGHQYVAAYSGGHVQGGPRGDSVWLFSLDGTLEQVPPAQQSAVRLSSNASTEVNIEAGKTAYFNSCVFCHGADGKGGHGGPAFSAGLTVDTIERTVAGGRNQMPAFGSFLNDTTIANLAAWVHELAQRAGTGQAK